MPAAYRAADGTIALRMPAHASTIELVRQVGPRAASSANLSGGEAPAAVSDLDPSFAQSGICIFDDGSTPSGAPSTVVDCTGPALRILRQGSIVV